MTPSTPLRPETDVVTRGFDPMLSVGSARPAVFRSSTYVFSSPEAAERAFAVMGGRAKPTPGESLDLVYSRFNHPNAQILEERVLSLEPQATCAAVFNSGMSAIVTAVLAMVKPGDRILYTVPIYGATQTFVQGFLAPFGVEGIPIAAGETAAIAEAVRTTPQLRVILIETPANPTLVMTDIAAAAQAAKARAGEPPILMVDNTFLGPTFQHALALGADLSIYSATKYLGGFSDLIGGVALARDEGLMAKIRSKRSLFGTILQPDECWILDTRLPTVSLRMQRQAENAQKIVQALQGHAKIAKIYYPTLFEDAEQRRIAESQTSHPGGIFSIDLHGRKKAAFDFLRTLKLARNAVSLGGVETLACHPRSTTHSSWTAADLESAGVTEGLVRVSLGIEDWEDLLADFQAALEKA